MNTDTFIRLLLIPGLLLPAIVQGEESAEAIAEKNSAAYVKAWKAADAAAMASLFSEDAEYTTDSGEQISGREAIEARSKEAVSLNPGTELEIITDSVRFLTPDVLSESGFATLSKDGVSSTTLYQATYVKKGEEWLIAELHEYAPPPIEPSLVALSNMDWVVGKWSAAEEGAGIQIEAKWVLGGRFIARSTSVAGEEGAEPFVSFEIIGYDTAEGELRSWIFDSEGGFGHGTWRQDGDKWLVQIAATMPDGSISSGDHEVTILDDSRVSVETTNRVLNGELLPNREPIEFHRVKESSETTSEK